jgi:hypothetical protein
MRKVIYASTVLTMLVASLIATPAVAQQAPTSRTPPPPVPVQQDQRSLTPPSASQVSINAYELQHCAPSTTTWNTLAATKVGGHTYTFVARTCLYWDSGLQRMRATTFTRSRRNGAPWTAYSINGDTVTMWGFTAVCSTCTLQGRVGKGPGAWADQGGTGRDFTSNSWCTGGSNWYYAAIYHLRIAWTSTIVSSEHGHDSFVQGPYASFC